jgi:hypothetical protein
MNESTSRFGLGRSSSSARDPQTDTQQNIISDAVKRDVILYSSFRLCFLRGLQGTLITRDVDRLLEAVKTSGMKYMMFDTSCYRADCYAMWQIYQAGGFGRFVYSEGEYHHDHSQQIGSYKNWRVGSIPLWYPTHFTAYYVGVTDKPFTSVSCTGSSAGFSSWQPGVTQSALKDGERMKVPQYEI